MISDFSSSRKIRGLLTVWPDNRLLVYFCALAAELQGHRRHCAVCGCWLLTSCVTAVDVGRRLPFSTFLLRGAPANHALQEDQQL
eukprot:COSAG05_NODE_18816_length_302_cov_1.000000_1_plen_84_part_01